LNLGLDDHDRLRRRRRLLRGCQRLGLLNDDHRLTVDDLGGAVLGFDDYVRGRVGRYDSLTFSLVSVVWDIEPIAGRPAVAVCAFVVGGRGRGRRNQRAKHEKRKKSNEGIHSSSFMCMSFWACRHPPAGEQARPARHSARKVLGFLQFG
jgi:predicted metal-binding protein